MKGPALPGAESFASVPVAEIPAMLAQLARSQAVDLREAINIALALRNLAEAAEPEAREAR